MEIYGNIYVSLLHGRIGFNPFIKQTTHYTSWVAIEPVWMALNLDPGTQGLSNISVLRWYLNFPTMTAEKVSGFKCSKILGAAKWNARDPKSVLAVNRSSAPAAGPPVESKFIVIREVVTTVHLIVLAMLWKDTFWSDFINAIVDLQSSWLPIECNAL